MSLPSSSSIFLSESRRCCCSNGHSPASPKTRPASQYPRLWLVIPCPCVCARGNILIFDWSFPELGRHFRGVGGDQEVKDKIIGGTGKGLWIFIKQWANSAFDWLNEMIILDWTWKWTASGPELWTLFIKKKKKIHLLYKIKLYY